MLGLTVQCAQCHTHKYDPLTHTEYYRMMAFLNNEHEACITVLLAGGAGAARDAIRRQIAEIEDEMQERRSRLARADGRVGSAGRKR